MPGPWKPLTRDGGVLGVGIALLIVALVAWAGVIRKAVSGAAGMDDMGNTAGATLPSLADGAAFVGAWGVMMAAMMLPSAAPMILLYRTVSRSMAQSGQHAVLTLLFAATYSAVWLLFGIPVYLSSAAVAYAVRMNPAFEAALPYALGAVLVAAGAYQFAGIKRVCLKHCQNPLSFLMHRWRAGYGGTLRVGVAHALYCVGCCWGLMAVLVAAGAMGLPWVLGIAVIVFAEKVVPRGEQAARLVGIGLLILGAAVAVRPDLAVMLRSGHPMAM